MATRATATFAITGWDDTVYDEPAEGPKLGRVTVKKAFQGEVMGGSVAELLTCLAEDGSAGYVATERVTGRIGDRAGTFVVQHGGITGDGEVRSFGSIVPGSGTGELRGLRGEARFRHDENGAIFTLDYDLPDA